MTRSGHDYGKVRGELSALTGYACHISGITTGLSVPEWRLEYASYIFAKICCHVVSSLSLAPAGLKPRRPQSYELWDLSSLCSLVRAVIDAYFALYYIAVDSVGPVERAFRQALWTFEGEHKRLELLRLGKAKSPEVAKLQTHVVELRNTVVQHPFYAQLASRTQQAIRKGDRPLHLSNSDLCQRAGMQPDFYRSVFRYLSSYVHTYPFSVSQLALVKAGDARSLGLFSVTLQHCLVFLAFALRDFRGLFENVIGHVPEPQKTIMDQWIYVGANAARA